MKFRGARLSEKRYNKIILIYLFAFVCYEKWRFYNDNNIVAVRKAQLRYYLLRDRASAARDLLICSILILNFLFYVFQVDESGMSNRTTSKILVMVSLL